MSKILDFLRKALDPSGPLGEVVSPADVFKTHAGLPYEVGHRQRAELAPLPASEVAKACAPERFVAKGEIDVPYSRERVVSPYVLEKYAAVMRGMEIIGWRVTQEPRSQFCDCSHAQWSKEGGQLVHATCGRRREPKSDAEIMEIALSVQMQPSDAYLEGYAITIPGKDKGLLDGIEVTGGTYVRNRKHHRELTKDMVHWDRGTPREVEKALATEKAKREAHTARKVEEMAHRLVSDHPGDL